MVYVVVYIDSLYGADKCGLFPAWIKPAVSVILYLRPPSLSVNFFQVTEPPPCLQGRYQQFQKNLSVLSSFLSGVKALTI